ncbi:hypothetical protein B0H34DRAFT_657986 [Crassisporium funariophilum]|nr:hypothetical protein B0H34DRAFT_657986 [Crassisporium funariophilum]
MESTCNLWAPFKNFSRFLLMSWFYNSSNTKSIGELQTLVKDVLLHDDFKINELEAFNATNKHALMDAHQESAGTSESGERLGFLDDTWIKGTVNIFLPCDKVRHESEDAAPQFPVDVYYRKPLDVIRAALSEPDAERFHTFPFKAFWKPSEDDVEERLYSETFTGDAWNDAYEQIQQEHLHGPNENIEAFMVGLMIWSDSTFLAQFGTADLWPIYLYFGNQSKYTRCKPSSFSAHHIAYMPKVKFSAVYSQY